MKFRINFLMGFLIAALIFGVAQVYSSTTASRQYNFVDDKNNSIPITASRMDAEFDNVITKLNQKVIISTSAPSSPIAGMLWYDSTNKLLKQYRNSEWVTMGSVHISSSAPSTPQAGDIWVDTGSSYAVKVRDGSGWITLAKTTDVIDITGAIKMWPTTSAPTGYLVCDGTAVSRSAYAALFAIIGTTFGTGDGSTTFNLPNFKSRFPAGYNAADTPFDAMAETGGAQTHTHTYTSESGATSDTGGAGGSGSSGVQWTHTHTVSGTTAAGSSLPPYLTINFIIKT